MVGRGLWLGLLFLLGAGVLTLRLAQLQLIRGAAYAAATERGLMVTEMVPAQRGQIRDRYGVALADNRAGYDLALVFADLTIRRRDRLLQIDCAALGRIRSDLALFIDRSVDDISRIIEEELQRSPGVAVRPGPEVMEGEAELIAVPRHIFRRHVGVIGRDADALQATDDDQDAGPLAGWDVSAVEEDRLQRLAVSGLLGEDMRDVLEREFVLRRGQGVVLLTDGEWNGMMDAMARRFSVPPSLVDEVLVSFAIRIRLVRSAADTADEGDLATSSGSWTWLLLHEDDRRRGVEQLGRFLGTDPTQVSQAWTEFQHAARQPFPVQDWLFMPSMRIDTASDMLPEGLHLERLQLADPLQVRSRIYYLQDDEEVDPQGFASRLYRRLAADLGIDVEQISGVVRFHARSESAGVVSRRYRSRHLLLDAGAIDRLCRNLSDHLNAMGLAFSVLDLEGRVAALRRIVDRDWRGQTRHDPVALLRDIPHALAVLLSGTGNAVDLGDFRMDDLVVSEPAHPGLRVVSRTTRVYPQPYQTCHIVGWLGRLSAVHDREASLTLGLDPQGWIGRRGLERQYDSYLQGIFGTMRRIRTPYGQREVGEPRPPRAGADLHTTIDLELQLAAYEALQNWWPLAEEIGAFSYHNPEQRRQAEAAQAFAAEHGGSAGLVLIDVHDGAILAMASTPGYDANTIHRDFTALQDIEAHPGRPLHDFAAEAWESPGSVIKPLVGLAAMLDGVYQPGERITTRGYMTIHAGQRLLRDAGGLAGGSTLEMREALSRSSNTFFATLARRISAERLTYWYDRVGVGRVNARDVGWQVPGRLPTPDTEPHWYPADTWFIAIGQKLSSSPLEMVSIPALVANGGTVVQPYLWHDLPLRDLDHIDIPDQYLAEVRAGMEGVTAAGGTARWLRLSGPAAGIPVAAKTGTSQWGSARMRREGLAPNHAWLIGYAPADAPEVAFAIFIRGGFSGGRACSGVAKRLLEVYFARRRSPRQEPGLRLDLE